MSDDRRGPVTVQTDAVMVRVGERTEAHLRDALARQREELARDWEARQKAQEEQERQQRVNAVKHWTGLVGFGLALLGSIGAGVTWWTARIRAGLEAEIKQDTMDGRLRDLERKLDTCTGKARKDAAETGL